MNNMMRPQIVSFFFFFFFLFLSHLCHSYWPNLQMRQTHRDRRDEHFGCFACWTPMAVKVSVPVLETTIVPVLVVESLFLLLLWDNDAKTAAVQSTSFVAFRFCHWRIVEHFQLRKTRRNKTTVVVNFKSTRLLVSVDDAWGPWIHH